MINIEPFPDAVSVLRPTLALPLAVALLRSTYNAIDELDVYPMDQFQIAMWKTRQRSYEAYRRLIDPLLMKQGDLTNALYFDYMSFAQFSALNAILNKENGRPDMEFEEKLGFDGEVKKVTRDEKFATHKEIIPAMAFLIGRNIYNYLKYGFDLTESEPFEGPVPDFIQQGNANSEAIKSAVDTMMKVFLNYGFCSEFSTSFGEDEGRLVVKLAGPAMLWSIGALEAEGCRIVNDYIGYVLSYFLKMSGIKSQRTYAQNDKAMVYIFDIIER